MTCIEALRNGSLCGCTLFRMNQYQLNGVTFSVHLGFWLLQDKASPHWTSSFEINCVHCQQSTCVDCWSQWTAAWLTVISDRLISKILRNCYFFSYFPLFCASLSLYIPRVTQLLAQTQTFQTFMLFLHFLSPRKNKKTILSLCFVFILSANFPTKFPCCLPSKWSVYSQSSF